MALELPARTVIPSVHDLAHLDHALAAPSPVVLLTGLHLGNLAAITSHCHDEGKQVLVRPDLVGGFRSDAVGLRLLRQQFRVDGVLTSTVNTVKYCVGLDLAVFWRCFLLDSRALSNALDAMRASHCTGFEILPAPVAAKFAGTLLPATAGKPTLAGGFVSDAATAIELFDLGYTAVTSSARELWDLAEQPLGSERNENQ